MKIVRAHIQGDIGPRITIAPPIAEAAPGSCELRTTVVQHRASGIGTRAPSHPAVPHPASHARKRPERPTHRGYTNRCADVITRSASPSHGIPRIPAHTDDPALRRRCVPVATLQSAYGSVRDQVTGLMPLTSDCPLGCGLLL